MYLSGKNIADLCGLEVEEVQVQPNSVDLTLDSHFWIPNEWDSTIVMDTTRIAHNCGKACEMGLMLIEKEYTHPQYEEGNPSKIRKGVIIEPQENIIMSTREKIKIPKGYIGIVDGRSSLGRWFISIHCTAGFIDQGFEGKVTLEVTNHSNQRLAVWEGQRICQLRIALAEESHQYFGVYQYQDYPCPSKGAR